MHKLNVTITIPWNPAFSQRASEYIRMFGIRLNRHKDRRMNQSCRLNIKPGQICLIGGSSGSGKSMLLNAFYEKAPRGSRIRLEDIPLEDDAALIDCVEGSLWNATRTLSKAGLSDAFAVLTAPALLSPGQQWRYRLAKALMSDKQWIFADEFTTSLDRITACVIAHNLRKLANQTDKIFILASCHEDMLIDLQPDVILIKYLNGTMREIYRDKSQGYY